MASLPGYASDGSQGDSATDESATGQPAFVAVGAELDAYCTAEMRMHCNLGVKTDLINTIREEHRRARDSQRQQLQEHTKNIEQLLANQIEKIDRTLGEEPTWLSGCVGAQGRAASDPGAGRDSCPKSCILGRVSDSDEGEPLSVKACSSGTMGSWISGASGSRAGSLSEPLGGKVEKTRTSTLQPDPVNRTHRSASTTSFGETVTVSYNVATAQGMLATSSVTSLRSGEAWSAKPQAQKPMQGVVPAAAPRASALRQQQSPTKSQPATLTDESIVTPLPILSSEDDSSGFGGSDSVEEDQRPVELKQVSGEASKVNSKRRTSCTSNSSADSAAQAEEERMEWNEHIKEVISTQLKGTPTRTYERELSVFVDPHTLHAQILILAKSSYFSSYCSTVVLSNSLFIGTDTSFQMLEQLDGVELPFWLRPVDLLFTLLFTVELTIRLGAFRKSFFFGPEWKWNIFDFALVSSAIMEEILINFKSMSFLRVFRGLRMLRVLRLVRVFRVMRDLRLMVCSVLQSFMSFFWALMLLFVIMYLASVFFMQGLILNGSEIPSDDFLPAVTRWYKSIWQAFVTMVMCITGGVDWNEALRPLSQVHWLYEVVFVFYILFIVIGVLNVLTGIFVERAQELSGLDRDLVIQGELKRNEAFLMEMKDIFEEADTDGSNSISWQEFKEYLKREDVKAYLASHQLDAHDAKTLFDILDLENEDEISIEEFIMGCMRLKGRARSVDVVALLEESRTAHRKLKEKLDDLQEQVAGMALLVGGSVKTEEVPSSRRNSLRHTRTKKSIVQAQLSSEDLLALQTSPNKQSLKKQGSREVC